MKRRGQPSPQPSPGESERLRRGDRSLRCSLFLAGLLSARDHALRGARARPHWTLRHFAEFARRPDEWRRALGELSGSRSRPSRSPRRSAFRSRFSSSARNSRAAARSARSSRCRSCCRRSSASSRFSFSTARAASSRASRAGRARPRSAAVAALRAPAPSCSSTPTRCTSTSTSSRAPASPRLDGAYLEAAAALGAGPARTLAPGDAAAARARARSGAALLTFMTSLASFSAPYVFGGTFRVLTTQILFSRLNGDIAMAMVETSVLAAVALAGLFLLQRSETRATPGARGRRARPRRRRGAAWAPRDSLVAGAGWLLAVFLLLPHATLMLVSLVPARHLDRPRPLPPVLDLVQLPRRSSRSPSACARSSTRSGWRRSRRRRRSLLGFFAA